MQQVLIRDTLGTMFPTLFSIGNFPVSSFGVFLALSFLYGIFLVWRLARAMEMDEERVLDLILVTFMGGLIGARLFFAAVNPLIGFDLEKIILIHKYPGFSFWGGLLAGFLTLILFVKKLKVDLWQVLDVASVGLLGGLVLSEIGCFLGGCNIGIASNLFFALSFVGVVGKRIPVQLIEAMLYFILLKNVWSVATHFHPPGKILSITLIFMAAINLVTLLVKQSQENLFFCLPILILGLILFYKVTKRNPLKDFKNMVLFPLRLLIDYRFRNEVLVAIKKSWYNQKISINLKLKSVIKKVRNLNVRFSHKNSKYY